MTIKRVGLVCTLAALSYYSVSYWVYSFRHPDQTDTQRFIHTMDVLTWK